MPKFPAPGPVAPADSVCREAPEIGRILGIRPKTVWTRLHRARKAMTRLLAGDEAAAGLGEEER